ncbi:hypothetical protein SCLCIDRAFT_571881 [Scleroderma citrinum Foug A]|uniref:Uncharacterized protein n=1 Tax=Scleroderma citrinum Foug A TaxID=1036808 RepID=A0A0C3D873_9AGAM|nr:hypothetical protein SCLCIDRAFT_571881 [Scleroderma citrinum Foug A]
MSWETSSKIVVIACPRLYLWKKSEGSASLKIMRLKYCRRARDRRGARYYTSKNRYCTSVLVVAHASELRRLAEKKHTFT